MLIRVDAVEQARLAVYVTVATPFNTGAVTGNRTGSY